MKLSQLLSALHIDIDQASQLDIHGMTLDSREVSPGDVFIALQGSDDHGMRYADQAIRQGAVAILCDQWSDTLPQGIPVIQIDGLRHQLGHLAHAFYEQPAAHMQIIGVTGTNGKTTTVHLIGQLANHQGLAVGRIGTLGVFVDADQVLDSDRTTPDAIHVAAHFAAFRERGAKLCAMEVSSHALDQGRVVGVPFEVAVMTNLTRDHLDYHGTMEAYGAAKKRLFTDYGIRAAVIDIDDAFGAALASSLSPVACWTIGTHADARVRIVEMTATAEGTMLRVEVDGQRMSCHVPLLGDFNARNTLAAAAALHATGHLDWRDVPDAVASLRAAPGRMEAFQADGLPTVVVDYAHTPDALAQALKTARCHTEGQLWVVFGCGGDRDRGKRELMGRVAAEAADQVVLTSDNPRSESPAEIVAAIRSGIDANIQIQVELDRSRAIQSTFDAAAPEDLILVAGKGHERTQTIGNRVMAYSDRATVAQLFGLMSMGGRHAS